MNPQQNSFLNTHPSIRFKQNAFKSNQGSIFHQQFPDFVTRLREQIQGNTWIYEQFVPPSELLKMLQELEQRYYDHQSSKEVVGLIIDFLIYCKNQSRCQPKLPTTYNQNYIKKLSVRWQKVRDPVYYANKGHLRILSFILENPINGESYYGKHFGQFQMDLSEKSCIELAAIGIQMCREHTGSFALLTNFLWGSCLNLNKKGTSIQEIQKRYRQVLEILCEKYPPAPKIYGEKNQLDIHSLPKQQNLIPKLLINLKDKPNKDQFLNDCIMERAKEAKEKYDQFYKFMHQVCEKNNGFNFKSGLKIKERSETKALLRIKEKMLKEIYSDQLQQKMSESKIRSSNKLSLSEIVQQEKRKYVQKMKEIYENRKEPLQFKVSDMLRGKCAFSKVEKINQCCTNIIEALQTVQYKHLKLIEIDNRLSMGTSDLVLKILFGNVIAEMQLVIDRDASNYAFAHKLYQLKRSQFFNPLTQLSIMNESMSSSYLIEAKAYIDGNTQNNVNDYGETTTFQEVSKEYGKFIDNLPLKIDMNKKFEGCLDLSLMKEEISNFGELVKAKFKGGIIKKSKWEIKYIEGKYFYEMKEYKKSRVSLNEALSETKKLYERFLQSDKLKIKQIKLGMIKIFGTLGDIFLESGKYIDALKYYEERLSIQEDVEGKGSIETAATLGNMGLVYAELGEHTKALDAYKQCLQIKEKEKKKGSIETASTLGNMGLVYADLGEYTKALDAYKQCLQIEQRVKGKGSIETASTLANMGIVYKNKGDYSRALEAYKQCLQIQQKVKGKGSIDTASTLGNMGIAYKCQFDYPRALQAYKQCLQIQERVKGKGNIETAFTYNNIGDYSQAFPLFEKSLPIYKKCGRPQLKIVADNLAKCYRALKKVDKLQSLIQEQGLNAS